MSSRDRPEEEVPLVTMVPWYVSALILFLNSPRYRSQATGCWKTPGAVCVHERSGQEGGAGN
jgi:hypothetical protein